MPKLERQDWRLGDAVDILQDARIVGRAQGSRTDGSRFDGLIIEKVTHTPNPDYVPPASTIDEAFCKEPYTTEVAVYVAFWLSGHFLVEHLEEGHEFTCETCGQVGIVGRNGPRYGLNGGLDRDPRDQSPSRCDGCR